MARSNLTTKWISEYCAPVVSTISSTEAENVCLKNGLLLHELLSAFGHLDGIHATIRSSTQMMAVSDAHIRFERSTEARAKSPIVVEELLRSTFEEYDFSRLPSTVAELKSAVPSAWTHKMEQAVVHSMSFSEYEMISQPIVLLMVVATSDADPISKMQELCANAHLPPCLSTGQYEAAVHTVYLMIHDEFSTATPLDAAAVFRRFQAKFPPSHSRLLVLNSLSPDAPNVHQPDMWSRGMFPLYFPQNALLTDMNILPVHPVNGERVIGSRLSMEDFMSIRDFCIGLYHQDIVPQLERRIFHLSKLVTDARKGMKNVLKSFWRKPREELPVRGTGGTPQVRYRVDRIESQISLLADSCFMIKDYETALSMYKMVRDDYKSDKSIIHLANTNLMIAACYTILEPGRKDLVSLLESTVQSLLGSEPLHACAYFALLASEMMTMHPNPSFRSPLEAAQVLLLAANSTAKLPLLSGLLTDRASVFMLQAGHQRKFCLQQVLAGRKLHLCGPRPARQALVHYASALMVHDRGHWGGVKAKLAKLISDDLKREEANQTRHRALLLMLRMIDAALNTAANVSGRETIRDAVMGLRELMAETDFGNIAVLESWDRLSIYQILLGPIPVSPIERPIGSAARSFIEVSDLAIPALNKTSLFLLRPINGYRTMAAIRKEDGSVDSTVAEELLMQLDIEKTWGLEQEALVAVGASTAAEMSSFPERIAAAELLRYGLGVLPPTKPSNTAENILRVPLGENIVMTMKLSNRLPVELALTGLRLEMSPEPESFEVTTANLHLPSGSNRAVELTLKPTKTGLFQCEYLLWSLSDSLAVRQSLRLPGKLIHKSLIDRSRHARSPETNLQVEVVPGYPLLHISFEGLSAEVLQGQLLKATLILTNEGSAPAGNLDLKLSQPCFVFYLERATESSKGQELVPLWGQSCTIVRLPPETLIAPGEQLRLCAWLRIGDLGKQSIAILASYQAITTDGNFRPFSESQSCRTSFVSVETTIIPSINVSARVAARPSSTMQRILVVDVANNTLPPPVVPVPQLSHPGRSSWDSRSSLGNPLEPIEAIRRFSSKGQIDFDLSCFEESSLDLDEGQFKIEGILVFGAANPVAHGVEEEKYKKLAIGSAENLVVCVPIDFVDRSQPSSLAHTMSSRVILESNWAIHLTVGIGNSIRSLNSSASDGRQMLTKIIERFLCSATANDSLQKQLRLAREKAILDSLESNNAGPRTISQVRKERLKESTELEEIQLEDVSDEEQDDNVLVNQFSASCNGLPMHVHDLALADLGRGCSTVVVIWSCRWQEKLRTGMHFLPNLSLLQNAETPIPKTVSAPTLSGLADGVLVAFSHVPIVSLPVDGESIVLDVTVELRSVREATLFVTIEAVDRRTPSAPVTSTTTVTPTAGITSAAGSLLTAATVTVVSPSNAAGSAVHPTSPSPATVAAVAATSSAPTSGKSNRNAPKGLRWEGKTKHVGVALSPFSVHRLVFKANISRKGVFDLKRFKVLVSAQDPRQQQPVGAPDNTAVLKNIPGQSLVEVV